jgi:hypothetical protein
MEACAVLIRAYISTVGPYQDASDILIVVERKMV